jgi:amidase
MAMCEMFRPELANALRQREAWRRDLLDLFGQVELLALPTLPIFPPRLDAVTEETMLPIVIDITRHVSLFNAAGTPCTAQRIPAAGSALPTSLQLVGPLGGEELLLPTALRIESAVG